MNPVVVHFFHDAEGWQPLLLVGPYSITPLWVFGTMTMHQQRAMDSGAKSIAFFPSEQPRDGYMLRETIDEIANAIDARRAS
jgi:hypothetical protein